LAGFVELGIEKISKSKIMSAVVDKFGGGMSVGCGKVRKCSGAKRRIKR